MIKQAKRLLVVLAAVLLVPASLWPSAARAATLDFSALYFFGDNLSDTGNAAFVSSGAIPPATTYVDGRFNGPIWADYLAGHLGFAAPTPFTAAPLGPSVSFAFGGSGTGEF